MKKLVSVLFILVIVLSTSTSFASEKERLADAIGSLALDSSSKSVFCDDDKIEADPFNQSMHHNDDPSCKMTNDPFERGARVLKGKDKGQCINTQDNRPVRVLSEKEMKQFGFKKTPGKVVIANFKHHGKFYVAEIPTDKVKDLIFQIEIFKVNMPLVSNFTSHAQVRAIFDEPIILKEQTKKNGKTLKLNDIIFSLQATGVPNKKYDPVFKGTDGSYSNVLGVFSSEHKLKGLASSGNEVTQYKMNLTDAQKSDYINRYLKKSDHIALANPYNTLTNNCSTNQFDIIDRVRGESIEEVGLKSKDVSNKGVRIPMYAATALESRELIDGEKSRLEDFNKDPRVQKYK